MYYAALKLQITVLTNAAISKKQHILVD